ncbi:arginine N-succinyltransferase [Persicimonas caeni]|uniref:Arginine N-succinyltransferase n=1 Tax=Persicimonas caeni TaxID=2292766 RepID=A0A4Y6PUC8_PERCE|nr:arginine N-succinyltransferase [Persicimonas caeni]QDG51954.1 arginine N-succinyltransferase [Persicimonas caeni]QED33175.1 arginine N-succinyltransferase [Persicimonas caeni]
MFLLREVIPTDLEQLRDLARRLNTLNLPNDSARLQKLVDVSRGSFGGVYREAKFRDYLFVLEDLAEDRLIGSCLIIAQHGTYERPAVYFNVREEQKYSTTLDKHFVHQVLQLTFNYDGPTEIGGLILHPDYRGHQLKLGKLLSFVRFLFIGLHRDLFRDRIVAELLPPLNPDGTSDLWDCLGQNFTHLDYRTADLLSRDNVEFIRSLFPSTPIYTSLLPEHVRDLIGVVGKRTRPAKRMLEGIGFRWDHSIDPFDGGPTYAVEANRCEPVTRTKRVAFAGEFGEDERADGRALVSVEDESREARFMASLCEYREVDGGVELRGEALEKLAPEGEVGMMRLSW